MTENRFKKKKRCFFFFFSCKYKDKYARKGAPASVGGAHKPRSDASGAGSNPGLAFDQLAASS